MRAVKTDERGSFLAAFSAGLAIIAERKLAVFGSACKLMNADTNPRPAAAGV
jgi:hypothetical protein